MARLTFNSEREPISGRGWQADLRILTAALKHPEGFNYEARLPDIIGYVPSEEQEQFSTFTPRHVHDPNNNFVCLAMSDQEVQRLAICLPETVHTLLHDTYNITQGKAIPNQFELRRQFVAGGSNPHFYGLHLDVGITTNQPETAKLPIYLISDSEPTLFYEGPATLHMPDSRSVRLDTATLDSDRQLVQAPPYAIVRLNYATVHTSPIFRNNTTRTFMRVFTAFDTHIP